MTLYDIGIANIHGYALYRFGDAAAKARPFVFGGGGMTLLSARDLESETKLSFGLGGGLSVLGVAEHRHRRAVHVSADDDERQ